MQEIEEDAAGITLNEVRLGDCAASRRYGQTALFSASCNSCTSDAVQQGLTPAACAYWSGGGGHRGALAAGCCGDLVDDCEAAMTSDGSVPPHGAVALRSFARRYAPAHH